MEINLGFSTGCLHKDMRAKEAIAVIKSMNCDVIELGFVKKDRVDSGWMEEITKEDLEGFEFVSMHAPTFAYGNNEETEDIFRRIRRVDELRKLDVAVFHPDVVSDFKIFQNAGFNVAFENMDNRKGSFQKPDGFKDILTEDNDFKFVLDTNHIYTNDKTMKLAEEFYKKLGHKLVEVQISGYEKLHDPLFQTQQIEIIKVIQDFSVPIIVESLLSRETIEQERDYILKTIQSD